MDLFIVIVKFEYMTPETIGVYDSNDGAKEAIEEFEREYDEGYMINGYEIKRAKLNEPTT